LSSRFQLFDYVKSINTKSSHLFDEAPDAVSGYIPYHVLTAFSYFPDTVLFANQLNSYPDICKQMHYDYLYFSLPERKRYAKWIKADKSEMLDSIQKCYNVNYTKAQEIFAILSDEQKEHVHKLYSQKQT
jgi:hypothetical protein